MRRILCSSLVILVLLGGLAAPAAAVKETIDRTVTIAADGRLSVQNVNGAIEISGWDRSDVHVVAIKKTKNRDELDDIRVEIKQEDGNVTIRTRRGDWVGWTGIFGKWFNDGRGEVEYRIKVPARVELDQVRTVNGSVQIHSAGRGVSAEAVNGSLTLEAVSGPLRLSTVNGAVKVQVDDLGEDGGISMHTVNGSVRLHLPAGAGARFTVKSVNGSIDTDFDRASQTRFLVGRSLRATLGNGEFPVNIKTVNGSVTIRTGYQSASR